jgi:hypothetical protein
MEIKVCSITHIPYVVIDGKVYLERQTLAEMHLSYIAKDFIRRVGTAEGEDYYTKEYDQAIMLRCITASCLTPEEFGQVLAKATRPVSLKKELDEERSEARAFIIGLPENDGLQPSNCFGVTLSIFGLDERDEIDIMIPVLLGLQDLAKSMGFTAARQDGDRWLRPHQHISFIDDTYTAEDNTKANVHLTYVDCKLWLVEDWASFVPAAAVESGLSQAKGESDVGTESDVSQGPSEVQSTAGPEGGDTAGKSEEGRPPGDPG